MLVQHLPCEYKSSTQKGIHCPDSYMCVCCDKSVVWVLRKKEYLAGKVDLAS